VTRATGSGHTLGVAVEIPPPYGQLLDEVRERFAPDAGEMPAHVTILAPVDVDADVMGAVLSHLDAVARRTRPFTLTLDGVGTFRPVSPVVFVAVGQGGADCVQLERDVRSGDLAVETRFPFHPHVTVAHDVDEAALDDATAELAGFSASMDIVSMGLHEYVDGRWHLVRAFPFSG
jgi:2'-5' RNA ligase